jgi:hypothetical protein
MQRAVMSKVYEVWDTATSNLVTARATEDDALAFVRAYVAQHGRQYALSWVLLWDDDATDQAGQIAEGSTLIARAEATNFATGTPPR